MATLASTLFFLDGVIILVLVLFLFFKVYRGYKKVLRDMDERISFLEMTYENPDLDDLYDQSLDIVDEAGGWNDKE